MALPRSAHVCYSPAKTCSRSVQQITSNGHVKCGSRLAACGNVRRQVAQAWIESIHLSGFTTGLSPIATLSKLAFWEGFAPTTPGLLNVAALWFVNPYQPVVTLQKNEKY